MKVIPKRLVQEINREHKAASANLTAYREHAKKCGEALIKAKKDVSRGEWMSWLKEHCPDLSQRTANQYMVAARDDTKTLTEARGVKSARLANSTKPVKNAPGAYSRNGNGHAEPDEDDVDDALKDDEDDEDEEELTEEEVKAVELVKQGKSYRQIAKELEVDESSVRRNPVIRRSRKELDNSEASSVSGGSFGACYVRQPPEMYELMKSEIDLLLQSNVTLNKEYKTKFSNLFKRALEGVERK